MEFYFDHVLSHSKDEKELAQAKAATHVLRVTWFKIHELADHKRNTQVNIQKVLVRLN